MAATISKLISFAFDPIYHWAAFAVLFFFLAAFRRRSALKVGFIFMMYMLVVVMTPLPAILMASLEEKFPAVLSAEEKPAVVVLSGGTVEWNKDIDQFAWYGRGDRIMEPLRKWKNSNAIFVISGKEPGSDKKENYLSETESMGKIALEWGVPAERIVLETKARSTRENAKRVQAILQERGIVDFYLVTSAFHMPRAMHSFEALGLRPTAFPVDFIVSERSVEAVPSTGAKNLLYFRTVLHEYFGSLYYKFLDWF